MLAGSCPNAHAGIDAASGCDDEAWKVANKGGWVAPPLSKAALNIFTPAFKGVGNTLMVMQTCMRPPRIINLDWSYKGLGLPVTAYHTNAQANLLDPPKPDMHAPTRTSSARHHLAATLIVW
jgi:hypothetical protein